MQAHQPHVEADLKQARHDLDIACADRYIAQAEFNIYQVNVAVITRKVDRIIAALPNASYRDVMTVDKRTFDRDHANAVEVSKQQVRREERNVSRAMMRVAHMEARLDSLKAKILVKEMERDYMLVKELRRDERLRGDVDIQILLERLDVRLEDRLYGGGRTQGR